MPTVALVDGVPEITGARLVVDAPVTLIENAGRLADLLPSDALMTMPDVVPTCELAGVPLKRPVDLLKLAHAGLLVIEKTSGSPFESLAVGWKLYATPLFTVVRGLPEMVGAALYLETARTENAGSAALLEPSVTRIWMLFQEPTDLGLPLSLPLVLLKLAQLGLFVIVNFSLCRSGSLAAGVNE